MNSLVLALIGVTMILAGYALYSRFLASKIYALDDSRPTPAHELEDGVDYVPTNKYVLWGHHFTSVAGAAPIVTGQVVENPSTIATAIRIGNPASWTKALAARDESGGR